MIFVLLLLLFSICIVDAYSPHGKYCGEKRFVKIDVKVNSLTSINLNVNAFGKKFECNNEAVVLHRDNKITVVHGNERGNCVNRISTEFSGVNMEFHYNSHSNEVYVYLPRPVGNITLTNC